MKKRLIFLLSCMTIALLVGCSNTDGAAKGTEAKGNTEVKTESNGSANNVADELVKADPEDPYYKLYLNGKTLNIANATASEIDKKSNLPCILLDKVEVADPSAYDDDNPYVLEDDSKEYYAYGKHFPKRIVANLPDSYYETFVITQIVVTSDKYDIYGAKIGDNPDTVASTMESNKFEEVYRDDLEIRYAKNGLQIGFKLSSDGQVNEFNIGLFYVSE